MKSVITSYFIAIICAIMTREMHLCPSGCQCLPTKRVTCFNAGLDEVPIGIPSDTTVLELSFNNLQQINKTDFSNLPFLRRLSLDHNKITSIATSSFWRNQLIQYLNLNTNELTAINRTTFWGLRDINSLYINDNYIEYLHPFAFIHLLKLQQLYMINSRNKQPNCTCNFVKQMKNLQKRVPIISARCIDIKDSEPRPRDWNDGSISDKYCEKKPTAHFNIGSIIGGVAGVIFFFCYCAHRRGELRRREELQQQQHLPEPPPEFHVPSADPVHIPVASTVTELSDGPPTYQSVATLGIGDTNAYSNPVFLDELPPPPSYDEVAGGRLDENSHMIGQTIVLQSVAHPTRQIRKRGEELWLEENDSIKDINTESCFTVVPGLSGRSLSLQKSDDPQMYFRHREGLCYVERGDGSKIFKDDCTFIFHSTGLTTDELLPSISLESANYPGFFVSHSEFRVQILQYSDTEEYKRNTSWFLKPHGTS